MFFRRLAAIPLASALLLSGCSIKQSIEPVALGGRPSAEICMISAPGVRHGFTEVYRDVLQEKGFVTTELPAGSNPSRCALATTYVGNWNWDLALYLSHADIKVFDQGRLIGKAKYDSRRGGGRLDKFINAETKIRELANQLFPQPLQVVAATPNATVPAPQPQLRAAMSAPAELGRWDRPAQLLGASMGCDEATLVGRDRATELYTAGCPDGLVSLRCEWSECAVLR